MAWVTGSTKLPSREEVLSVLRGAPVAWKAWSFLCLCVRVGLLHLRDNDHREVTSPDIPSGPGLGELTEGTVTQSCPVVLLLETNPGLLDT